MQHTDVVDPRSLPGLGSVTWRRFGELPGAFLAGTGLLLQVAHPVVGAGVLEHSEFKTRPWVRAWRTHLSTMRFVYGAGSGAHAEGARLIEAHREIKGVDARGDRYHALNPEAHAWVHLTLAKFMVDTAHWFGTPLTPSEKDQMWTEFRSVGLALGVKDHHMPQDWAGAQRRFGEVLRDRLEANQSTFAGDGRRLRRFARVVLATLKVTPGPLRYSPLAYSAIARARRREREDVAA